MTSFKILSVLFLTHAFPAASQLTYTYTYQVIEYRSAREKCPPQCPDVGIEVSESDWESCDHLLETDDYVNCDMKAYMILKGNQPLTPCVVNMTNPDLSAVRLDVSASSISSILDLAPESSITLNLGAAVKEACNWWFAPIANSFTTTCTVNTTDIKTETPANLTTTAGANNMVVPMTRLKNLGMVTNKPSFECADFKSVDYTSVKWVLFTVTDTPSGAMSLLALPLTLSLVYLFVLV